MSAFPSYNFMNSPSGYQWCLPWEMGPVCRALGYVKNMICLVKISNIYLVAPKIGAPKNLEAKPGAFFKIPAATVAIFKCYNLNTLELF